MIETNGFHLQKTGVKKIELGNHLVQLVMKTKIPDEGPNSFIVFLGYILSMWHMV
jgi:hypothetical protein